MLSPGAPSLLRQPYQERPATAAALCPTPRRSPPSSFCPIFPAGWHRWPSTLCASWSSSPSQPPCWAPGWQRVRATACLPASKARRATSHTQRHPARGGEPARWCCAGSLLLLAYKVQSSHRAALGQPRSGARCRAAALLVPLASLCRRPPPPPCRLAHWGVPLCRHGRPAGGSQASGATGAARLQPAAWAQGQPAPVPPARGCCHPWLPAQCMPALPTTSSLTRQPPAHAVRQPHLPHVAHLHARGGGPAGAADGG